MEYLIGIGALAVIVYFAFLKKEPPTLRETLEKELKRREDELMEVDTGTPQERYERAVSFWDTGLGVQQEKATKIYQRLIDENVEYAKPYISYGHMLVLNDPTINSGRVLTYFRRALEIEPDNENVKAMMRKPSK